MISQLSAKYHSGAMHTASTTTDGKVTNRVILSTESEKLHRLYLPVFWFEANDVKVNKYFDDLAVSFLFQGHT